MTDLITDWSWLIFWIPLMLYLLWYLLFRNKKIRLDKYFQNKGGRKKMPFEESGMSIGMKALLVMFAVIMVAVVMLMGLFRIDTGKGAIVTHIGGNRDATTLVGWHWVIPLFESYIIKPVVNDQIYFPSESTLSGAGGQNVGVSGVEINAGCICSDIL